MTAQADIKFPQAGWLGSRLKPVSRIKGAVSRWREQPPATNEEAATVYAKTGKLPPFSMKEVEKESGQHASEEALEQLQQHYAKNTGRG